MVLLILGATGDADAWPREISARMPDLELRTWPQTGDPADVDAVLTWMHPPGVLRQFPNLRVIISQGAGADHILRDPDLPRGVPIARVVDPLLVSQMSEYVAAATLRFHRRLREYEALQRRGRWQPLPPPDTSDCIAGVLGLGALGTAAAKALAALGFPVRGWSRSSKSIRGVDTYAGRADLNRFLDGVRVLVCLLPLTRETENILDAAVFARLARGAYLINAARGAHLVEDDLLRALDRGQLAGACLDVFRTEPLPAEHPFWSHPAITVTPHVASATIPRAAAEAVVDILRCVRAGRALPYAVDRTRGY